MEFMQMIYRGALMGWKCRTSNLGALVADD